MYDTTNDVHMDVQESTKIPRSSFGWILRLHLSINLKLLKYGKSPMYLKGVGRLELVDFRAKHISFFVVFSEFLR